MTAPRGGGDQEAATGSFSRHSVSGSETSGSGNTGELANFSTFCVLKVGITFSRKKIFSLVSQMTDNSGGRECEEEKAGPAVARVSPVTQSTAPATALATSPGGTKLSPPPSYKVNISQSEYIIRIDELLLNWS